MERCNKIMPSRKPKPEPVAVRLAEPEQVTDEQALQNMLYRPVRQLEGEPTWKISYPAITPIVAKRLLADAENDLSFRQRPTYKPDIRRWQTLYRSRRFVGAFPGGPVCLDETGVMINGKNRMTALAGLRDEEGIDAKFMFIHGVPRWMFRYFDTNRPRTIKDVFYIGNRVTKPQTPSAVKLAIRYEELLMGLRPATGWRHWNTTKDEHDDLDNFFERRQQLQDWYAVGEKIYRRAKLSLPAVMVFRFYQSLAWPDGDDAITEFCETLLTKDQILPSIAPVRLRDWSQDVYYNGSEEIAVASKRELHLMLLFRTFENFARETRINGIDWAYGYPMKLPYHPEGFEAALTNIKKALHSMDEMA